MGEMLHHHPRHDDVVVGDVEGFRDDVEVQELPRSVGELGAMMPDDIWNNIDAGVVDVGASLQKSTHPLQISTRNVQQANPLCAEILLQLPDNDV